MEFFLFILSELVYYMDNFHIHLTIVHVYANFISQRINLLLSRPHP